MFKDFQPLGESDVLLKTLEKWKRAYRYSEADRTQLSAVEVYGATQTPSDSDQLTGYVSFIPPRSLLLNEHPPDACRLSMTPFESLIYHLWLPKVRSALK